jgi:hypothetical protein
MLHDTAMSISGGPEDEASRIMLDALLRVDLSWGKPHLIFLGGGPQPVLMEALRAKGADLDAVVHVIVESPAWHDPELQRFVESTGGIYKRVCSSDFIQACGDLHDLMCSKARLGANKSSPLAAPAIFHCPRGFSLSR